jgi:protein involved in polysaccharide export with SLBB domain
MHQFRTTFIRSVSASCAGLFIAITPLHTVHAQLPVSGQLTGTEILQLRGAMGAPGSTLGGVGSVGLGSTSLGAPAPVMLALPGQSGADENGGDTQGAGGKGGDLRLAVQLPPNEFQKYLLQTTGKLLPLYGAEFFLNAQRNPTVLNPGPVAQDYRLRVGDALNVRLWGPVDASLQLTVDRNGEILLPKIGTVNVAGVTAADVERVVRDAVSKQFRNFGISVVPGRLRKLQVAVVGLARFPGTYGLSSEATITTALFASGGPGLGGSARRVQLRRQGQTIAEFDLYAFLAQGDKSADVRLQEGDVLVYPAASGYAAIHGAIDQPSVVELKSAQETLGDVMKLLGGVPVVADVRRATLERVNPQQTPPRGYEDLALSAQGLAKTLRNGDVVTIWPIVPDAGNAVTLTGAVVRPTRFAWRQGLRVGDVVADRSLLQSPETLRQRDELLFDDFERERGVRSRARVPDDLQVQRQLTPMAGETPPETPGQRALNATGGAPGGSVTTGLNSQPGNRTAAGAALADRANNADSTGIGGPVNPTLEVVLASEQSTARRRTERGLAGIGALSEELNLDYAAIERRGPSGKGSSVLSFNLAHVWADPSSADNLALEPGDVVTIFSARDLRVPLAQRKVRVRIEGEVARPGIYEVKPGEGLAQLIERAGGITPDAYLFGMGLFREEVRQTQLDNLQKIVRRLEQDSMAALSRTTQSFSGVSDAAGLQARLQAQQQAQQRALENVRSLKPEGRIALNLKPSLNVSPAQLPGLRFANGDRLVIPYRPDFVFVYGAVNTESAVLYEKGQTVTHYLDKAGIRNSADKGAVVLLRADGSALSSQIAWRNEVLRAEVMPGDSIVLPEKLDRESAWAAIVRNTRDFTQILYQLGLGVAALRVLRQ